MRFSFLIENVGKWWGGNPKTHKQAQIDIVATSAEDDSRIIGSCKFRENFVAEDEVRLVTLEDMYAVPENIS